MARGCKFFSLIPCVGNIQREKRERELWFLKNGAILLQELTSKCEDRIKPLQFFSVKELSEATNNYDKRNMLGSRSIFTTYKGTYKGRSIVVRLFGSAGHIQRDIDFIYNEIVMLSQINHRNVVKILGGCFETATPMVVYEFIANGSLYCHIHEKEVESRISWENRLRIATEVADALAYLHMANSKPIVHRGIKSSNILLDGRYTAKIVDFEESVSIPLGETHVKCAVVGTLGSIDPNYQSTGLLTEKCDVYSFGVLLLELLTGRKSFEWSNTREASGFSLVDFAISTLNHLDLFFEPGILKEKNMEQLMACADLAMECIRSKPEERPTMKEAAQELRHIQKIF